MKYEMTKDEKQYQRLHGLLEMHSALVSCYRMSGDPIKEDEHIKAYNETFILMHKEWHETNQKRTFVIEN